MSTVYDGSWPDLKPGSAPAPFGTVALWHGGTSAALPVAPCAAAKLAPWPTRVPIARVALRKLVCRARASAAARALPRRRGASRAAGRVLADPLRVCVGLLSR